MEIPGLDGKKLVDALLGTKSKEHDERVNALRAAGEALLKDLDSDSEFEFFDFRTSSLRQALDRFKDE